MTRSMNNGYNGYQLKAFSQFRILVSLFVDPENPDDYLAGYVHALNARQAMILAVSPFGRYDGYIVVRLSDIIMVLGEDDYAERLKILLAARGEEAPEPISPEPDEDLVHALCARAMQNHRVVTLWTSGGESAGFVSALNDMRVTLRALDFFGRPVEDVTLAIREVEMASMGAEDDNMLQLLSMQEPNNL